MSPNDTRPMFDLNYGGYVPPSKPVFDYGWGNFTKPGGGMDGATGNGMQFDPVSTAKFGGGGGIPATGPMGGGNWWDGALSTDKQQGWASPALGAASGIFNALMGWKQYGLAKDQLAQGKKEFGLNYDAQMSTTNSQLDDRQRARVASNPGAYQSVGTYMGQYGIKPRGG